MFVSNGQFKSLIVLFGAGLFSGLVLDIVTHLKESNIKPLSAFSKAVYFCGAFVFYFLIKDYARMGDVRLYMPLIFLAGNYISYRIFHKTLAFFRRKVYNTYVKVLIITKKVVSKFFCAFKLSKRRVCHAGGKVKKINSVVGRHGGSSFVYTSKYNGLSNGFDKAGSGKNRQPQRPNRTARNGKRHD